jgi:hypothetical protein
MITVLKKVYELKQDSIFIMDGIEYIVTSIHNGLIFYVATSNRNGRALFMAEMNFKIIEVYE